MTEVDGRSRSKARAVLDALPGIKQRDIRPCALCRKGLAHDGNLLFWRIRFDRLGLDHGAIQQQHGLEQFFGGGVGGAALAHVMGADPDIAKVIDGNHEALVCEPCVMEKLVGLFLIAEAQNEQADDTDSSEASAC